jgi:hypothetical protein
MSCFHLCGTWWHVGTPTAECATKSGEWFEISFGEAKRPKLGQRLSGTPSCSPFHVAAGIIDPKAQLKALLAKLLMRRLSPGGKPWKEILRHRVNHIQLSVHSKGPKESRHQLALCCPQTSKNGLFVLEKHLWILDEREGKLREDQTHLARGSPQATYI